MSKWKCNACGEAEHCDAGCEVDIWAGEPTTCPISGEEADWEPVAKGGN